MGESVLASPQAFFGGGGGRRNSLNTTWISHSNINAQRSIKEKNEET